MEWGRVNRIINYEDHFAVDLFPYKIKGRENFYDRDHPEKLSPSSLSYKKYWKSNFIKKCINGNWVNDNDTWVYMMPKLFFYINYVTVPDEHKNIIQPRLMDNEFIIFTYSFCADGFSGFEDDPDITCNELVEIIERKGEDSLSFIQKKQLEKSTHLKKADGTYKDYVNAWEYLTEYYLITNKRDFPLGNPIYDNPIRNEIILTARGSHKSYDKFLGETYYEFLFSGVRDYNSLNNIVNPILIGIGSSESKALSRSVSLISRAYQAMPGQYEFPIKKKGDKAIRNYGPLYKKIRGTWTTSTSGSSIQHIVKAKDGTSLIEGAMAQIMIMGPNDEKIGAGDRFKLILIEECGFSRNLKKIYSSNRDSLRVGDTIYDKVGKQVMIGTGGIAEFIGDSKDIFENPKGFEVYPIPNYWDKNSKECGLFLSTVYKTESFKDKQGNTLYKQALEETIKTRVFNKATKDRESFGKDIMFNPLYPKELLRPSHKSPLPIVELSDHLHELMSGINEGSSIFQKRCAVGTLNYTMNGVEFRKDNKNLLHPILHWGNDSDLENKEGAWLLFEQPFDNPPEGLYYILYDPIQQTGEGTSLQSIIVYKHFFNNGDQSMQDAIVASYIGRKTQGNIDLNFEEAIKAAKYYNAKIFSENTANAFAEYVLRKEFFDFVLPTPMAAVVLANGTGRIIKQAYTFGVKPNERMNGWSINKIAEWLLRPDKVGDDGIILRRNYQKIYDPRLLSELINFDINDKTNFDAVSALMLLPYILNSNEGVSVDIALDDEDDPYLKYEQNYRDMVYTSRPVSKFLSY